jgi:hypothetical protein
MPMAFIISAGAGKPFPEIVFLPYSAPAGSPHAHETIEDSAGKTALAADDP